MEHCLSTRQLGPWIGGKLTAGGSFVWETGDPITLDEWAWWEPYNYGGNETRVHYLSKTYASSREGTWNDLQPSGVWPIAPMGRSPASWLR